LSHCLLLALILLDALPTLVTQMCEGGWIEGAPGDYVASYAIDLEHFAAFIESTQPDLVDSLRLASDTPTRHKFLARLQGEITRRHRKSTRLNSSHLSIAYA